MSHTAGGRMVSWIEVKKLDENAALPTKANPSDAGWDLYSSEDKEIPPLSRTIVGTDVSMAIPMGYVGLIWPRSGLAVKHGLDVFAGVVDSGYRGEIKICLFNSNTSDIVHVKKGDRVAQLLFQEIPSFILLETEVLGDTDRGEKGFGSSGK